MLRGDVGYDTDVVMESLRTFLDASGKLGGLFPRGTETGEETRAAPAIWEDREGFEQALTSFRDAVESAIAASPGSVDTARPALGPVFDGCKNCHDGYRLEKD